MVEIDWEKVARDCGLTRDGIPLAKEVGPELLRLVEKLEREFPRAEATEIQSFMYRLLCYFIYRDPQATYARDKRRKTQP